jgi:hypothetical protein
VDPSDDERICLVKTKGLIDLNDPPIFTTDLGRFFAKDKLKELLGLEDKFHLDNPVDVVVSGKLGDLVLLRVHVDRWSRQERERDEGVKEKGGR